MYNFLFSFLYRNMSIKMRYAIQKFTLVSISGKKAIIVIFVPSWQVVLVDVVFFVMVSHIIAGNHWVLHAFPYEKNFHDSWRPIMWENIVKKILLCTCDFFYYKRGLKWTASGKSSISEPAVFTRKIEAIFSVFWSDIPKCRYRLSITAWYR